MRNPARRTVLDDLLAALDPVSLVELDERASLQRRIDQKYAVDREAFARLLDRLAGDHDVLEIDGRRRFRYETVYFDSPDLRCFRDHVEGRHPRFKARTRLYRDSGLCHFEVKLKRSEDETDKRHVDHPPRAIEQLTPEACGLLARVLDEAGLERPRALDPILRTTFGRATLAAREEAARITCDVDVRLAGLRDAGRRLRDGFVLVESKSEDGRGPADRVLAELGHEPIALSKYRTGIDLLVARDPSGETAAVRHLFS
jgi:VTC domain